MRPTKPGEYILPIWRYNCVPEKKVRRIIGSRSVSRLVRVDDTRKEDGVTGWTREG